MNIFNCPRCGEHKLEFMNVHAFCWECGYSPDEEASHCPIRNLERLIESGDIPHPLGELEAIQ